MSKASTSGPGVGAAASQLEMIRSAFVDEIGRAPTLVELLEVLGWSVPTQSDLVQPVLVPVIFDAKVTGATVVENSPREGSVADLNDNVFVIASGLLGLLAKRHADTSKQIASPQDLADLILETLHTSNIKLHDVEGKQVIKLSAKRQPKRYKANLGDVVAIPVLHFEIL